MDFHSLEITKQELSHIFKMSKNRISKEHRLPPEMSDDDIYYVIDDRNAKSWHDSYNIKTKSYETLYVSDHVTRTRPEDYINISGIKDLLYFRHDEDENGMGVNTWLIPKSILFNSRHHLTITRYWGD
jgi:hypothetical protein